MTSNKSLIVLLLAILLLTWQSITAQTTIPTTQTCKVTTTDDTYSCVVGKSGIRADKKEGDGATPAGSFLIREIFYRPDKLSVNEIAILKKIQNKGFILEALTQDDGWVDDVNSPDYNKFINLSDFKNNLPSHENLWRDDDKYDIIAVIGYNDDPVIKGKGSAIFMHIVGQTPSGQYMPTVGCVAFSKQDLLKVLSSITPETKIEIPAYGGMIILR